VEFLRLRPERRTAEMAREWWEGEVAVLERRKGEVDKERVALEEGVEVWRGAVKLVSEFEAGLKREMRGDRGSPGGGGRESEGGSQSPSPSPPAVTPEQAMFAQLDKMRAVMEGLEERVHVAEKNGWNLLICAIGAELEAFRQAEGMLRGALRDAGFDVGDDDNAGDQGDSTPQLGRSSSFNKESSGGLQEADPSGGGRLVDLNEGPGGNREPESDNEVPHDLLAGEEERESQSDNEVPADFLGAAEGVDGGGLGPTLSRQSSENEVPVEFLREHSQNSEYHSFDGTN
jgi:pyruvate kinase